VTFGVKETFDRVEVKAILAHTIDGFYNQGLQKEDILKALTEIKSVQTPKIIQETIELDPLIDIDSYEGGTYLLKEIRAKLSGTDTLLIKRTDSSRNNANNAHNKF